MPSHIVRQFMLAAASLIMGSCAAAPAYATGQGCSAVVYVVDGVNTLRMTGFTTVTIGGQSVYIPCNGLFGWNAGAPTGVSVDPNGDVNVNVVSSSNPSVGATGGSTPADADLAGVNVAGVIKGWTGDTNGYGDVNVENFPSTQTVAGSVTAIGLFHQVDGAIGSVSVELRSRYDLGGRPRAAPPIRLKLDNHACV